MNKDLFGNPIEPKRSGLPKKHLRSLERYDEASRDARASRQALIESLYLGYELHYLGDIEGMYLFREAQRCFVDAHYAAVILVAQAIVERTLQGWLESHGQLEVARGGLKRTLRYLKRRNSLPSTILDGIERTRKKRNLFAHLRPPDDDARMWRRMRDGEEWNPDVVLEQDATEALRHLFSLYHLNLNRFKP